MKKIKIKDIEIRYNESQSIKVDKIRRIINNNYSFFLLSLKKPIILNYIETNIEEFDKFFEKMVMRFYCAEDTKESFANPDTLIGLYTEILIRRDSINSKGLVKQNKQLDDSM